MAGKARYLSRDELLTIHAELVRRYGGVSGVRDEGALESCLAQPKTHVFGVERFATVIDKAAAYCFFLVRNHPFFDGNKRTGFVAALHFLRVNNLPVRFDEDEAFRTIMGVASGELELGDLVTMIAAGVDRAN